MTKLEKRESAWAVYALTRQGAEVAANVAEGLKSRGPTRLFLPERLKESFEADGYFQSSAEILARNFNLYRGHLVVGATGLVVRHIAPWLKSKKEDPAVVVLSQDGRWSISLVSGHLGGGNELALRAAEIIGGQAVITTATDVENLPALEMLAQEADLEIDDFTRLPAISRRLVEGEKLPLYDPEGRLAPFTAQWADRFELIGSDQAEAMDGPQVRVDYRLEKATWPEALIMRPKVLVLGLGCHKGLPPEDMEMFVRSRLKEAGLSDKSVALLATVEIRRQEPALLELSRVFDRPLKIFSKEELEKVLTPNPSETVLRRIGVPSVCEAAALLASGSDQLLISKQKGQGCTLAAALRRNS